MRRAVFILIPIILSIIVFSSLDEPEIEKINGANLVSPPRPVVAEKFDPLVELNTNWVSIIPYGFSRGDDPKVYYNDPRQWWGEREEGICELINHAKSRNLKIMLKPHVWVRNQGWTGDFELLNEEDWNAWEKEFANYILTFAKVADSLNVDLFCIGTEYRKVVQQRPKFWKKLIQDVRTVYPGKLTYAANWDNFKNVTFWKELDYIGIDAYFPLTDDPDPTLDDLKQSWEDEYYELLNFSNDFGKKILFTEYGYQSVDRAAGKHWEVDKSKINMGTQATAYQALFEVFWDKPWFAGGFFWKWHFREGAGGPDNPNFTPQKKSAEQVIREYYGRASDF